MSNWDNNFSRAQQDYDNQTDDRFDHDVEAIELDGLEEDMSDDDIDLDAPESDEPDWDSMNENW